MKAFNSKKKVGNPNAKVLFIVDNIDSDQLTETGSYQTFHNTIQRRKTNTEVLFRDDFYIIEIEELEHIDFKASNFSLIILSSKIVSVSGLNIPFDTEEFNSPVFESSSYSFFTNFTEKKIILQTENFDALPKSDLCRIRGDVNFISNDFTLKNNVEIYKENSIFDSSNLTFHQFTCNNCNKFNLLISNILESKISECEYCEASIFNSKQKLNTEVFTLKKNVYRTVRENYKL